MKSVLPVLNIKQFNQFNGNHDFYAERFLQHIRQHDFTGKPHKHDFFLVVFFTEGSGTHEIDFVKYKIMPGKVFFLKPGQTHFWSLSDDTDGWIFFHTREFFDRHFTTLKLKDFPFYSSMYKLPLLQLEKKHIPLFQSHFENIRAAYLSNVAFKDEKISALVSSLYIDITGLYVAKVLPENEKYTSRLGVFENLIETHFMNNRSPAFYAGSMNITERHLNRICKMSLNKTASDLLLDRVILESKRLLMRNDISVTEVADQLGYVDNSYFSRLFKKRTGISPKKFRSNYHS